MSTQQNTSGTELKRNLSRMDLVSMAVGQIIGAGIMAMTGTAIGMTGRSVNIAFLIAGVLCIMTAIPQIMVGGTARFKGGQYTQVATLGSQRLAGVFTMINVFTGLGVAMYIISFTEYLLALVPNAPSKLVSVVALTVLFAMNMLGTKQAAVLQTVMCAVMAAAIATFQVVLLVVTSSNAEIVGNLVILGISVVYALARNSKVTMEISYEDC